MKEQLERLDLPGSLFLCSGLDAFLSSVDEGRRYDAVLMDTDRIQSKTGIAMGRFPYRKDPNMKIIYTAGCNDRFFRHVFPNKADLSGYLVKPVNDVLLSVRTARILLCRRLCCSPPCRRNSCVPTVFQVKTVLGIRVADGPER